MKYFIGKLKPFAYIAGLYVIISLIMRCVFVFHPITTASFSFVEERKICSIGLFSDVLTIVLAMSILAIYFLFIANVKYKKPYGYLIFGALVLFLLYIQYYPNNIFEQYGGVIPEIALAFFGFKTFCFGLLLFLPKYRVTLRNILYFITLFIYVFAIVMNAVSEYFFWNEFGIRYNFIAVDYLIYTNEVIGNIMESYPVIPLFSGVFAVVLALTIWVFVKTRSVLTSIPTLLQKSIYVLNYAVLSILAIWALPALHNLSGSNIFAQEMQANGVYKFYYLFKVLSPIVSWITLNFILL